MEAALPVEVVEFDHSVEDTGDVSNMSAEEYLSWVRYQANKLPNVKRVDVKTEQRQSKYMPEVENILACPVDCLPSEEWQRDILFSFSELRQTLERLSEDAASRERRLAVPAMKDKEAWHRFCFAAELGVTATGVQADDNELPVGSAAKVADNEGFMAVDITDVNATDSAHRAMLKRKRDLAYDLGITLVRADAAQHDGAGDDHPADSDGEAEEGDASSLAEDMENNAEVADAWAKAEAALQWTGPMNVEPTTSVLLQFDQVLTQRLLALQADWLEDRDLTPARARWLYALLARLEKPLYRETAACVRQIYRRCCALRYLLCATSGTVAAAETVAQAKATVSAASSSENVAASGTAEPEQSPLEAFHNQLATLNMLISICGSYFGQGEEYDAFNYALSSGAAVADSEGDEEDEDGEEEGDWEEDGEDGEEEWEDNDEENGGEGGDCAAAAATQSMGQSGGWVARPGAVASTVGGGVYRAAHRAGPMELEEGEEEDDDGGQHGVDSITKRVKP